FIVGGADGYSYYSEILLGEINPADPPEITWSWGDSLPIPYNGRNGFAIKDNKLFMVGGAFDMGINEVWEYDILSGTWTSLPDYPKNCLLRDNMVERRDGPDSLGIVYCFMGDTSQYSSQTPTNECYRLTTAPFSGIKEKGQSEKNSIHLSNTIFTSDDITVKCMITGKCDLKINLYDVVGREIFSKVEKNISTGQHQLNIKENLKNGIYFIKIEAGSTIKNAKLILLR
ncbi:MAG: T9SS type A sorting domain-containing protein, partial [candidate division WOR-3 bacterium]